jgi:hypothetical protein
MAADLNYSRTKLAADVRSRPMKVYSYTANGPTHPTPAIKVAMQ